MNLQRIRKHLLIFVIILFALQVKSQFHEEKQVIRDIIHELPQHVDLRITKSSIDLNPYIDSSRNIQQYIRNYNDFYSITKCDTCLAIIPVLDSFYFFHGGFEYMQEFLKDTNNIPDIYPVDSLLLNNKLAKTGNFNDLLDSSYIHIHFIKRNDNELYAGKDQIVVQNIKFSRVYFNNERQYGIVYCWLLKGFSIPQEQYRLLIEKENGRWRINESVLSAIY